MEEGKKIKHNNQNSTTQPFKDRLDVELFVRKLAVKGLVIKQDENADFNNYVSMESLKLCMERALMSGAKKIRTAKNPSRSNLSRDIRKLIHEIITEAVL